MPNNNNCNTWSLNIRGGAMRGNLLHEYTLKTLAVPDSDAQSPFQYPIFPVSLTEVRKPIPKDYYYYYYYSQQQKVASSGVSFLLDEVRK
jgi:hypothetical protein